MITPIREETISSVRGKDMRKYMQRYVDIQQQFYSQVAKFGLDFDRENGPALEAEAARLTAELAADEGTDFYNNGKSICHGEKSTACKACAKGIGTATLFISFQCHRNCYFCFNPNQDNYEYYSTYKNDWRK